MRVVVLEKGIANMALVDDRHFVIISTLEGEVVIDDRCPHRGGPLRLGHRDCSSGALHCPWHATVIPEKQVLRRALPGVRVQKRLRVLLPETERGGAIAPTYSTAPTQPVALTQPIALTQGTVLAYAATPH